MCPEELDLTDTHFLWQKRGWTEIDFQLSAMSSQKNNEVVWTPVWKTLLS